MNTTVRVLLALAALGAGLVHLAVAAGAGSLLLSIAFVICGLAELTWAGFAIASGGLPHRRVVAPLALLPIAVWVLGLLEPDGSAADLPFVSLSIATLLDLVVAVGSALTLRRPDHQVRPESGARFTFALIVGAFAMSAIVMPALGATAAGIAASGGMHATHDLGADIEGTSEHRGH